MRSENKLEVTEEENRYLLFYLENGIFGTPLLGVREVTEPQRPKPIPNTQPWFLGVINIRGQVVGVMDLALRLGFEKIKGANAALLVFETSAGPIATLVERVEAVIRIDDKEIERNPHIQSAFPLEYLIGIAHQDSRLVTLIDLQKTCSQEDIRR
jgi:purine-binding chemotaxis protein CheW